MENTKLFMVLFGVIMTFFAINAMGMDWTATEHFSSDMENAMRVYEEKMQETELCFENLGTRNEIICTIYNRNVLAPNFGKY